MSQSRKFCIGETKLVSRKINPKANVEIPVSQIFVLLVSSISYSDATITSTL